MKSFSSTFFSKNYWLLKKIPFLNKHLRILMYDNSIRNLALIHQTISQTNFAEKYWILGGVLLGWIRDRDLIPGDEGDIDFAFNHLDEPYFLEIIPLLQTVGFQPFTKWKNNAGQITEYVLIKDGCKFEFFIMFENNNKFIYYGYSKSRQVREKNPWLEVTGEMDKYELTTRNIFGLPFLVPENPEKWLAEIYGDWQKSNPGFHFIDDELTIVNRVVWKGNNKWNG